MKHILKKLGSGLGLMATSASAFAAGSTLGLHTFGDPLIYAKGGGTPLYTAFLPSGNQSSDSVILLELTQGTGTAPGTWQYFVSRTNLGTAPAIAGMVNTISVGVSNDSFASWSITASTSGAVASSYTYYGAVGNYSTTGGPLAPSATKGEILVPFSYSSAVSSATCNISFNAYVGTDDYMQYVIDHVSANNAVALFTSTGHANMSSVSALYTITTKSGGATSDTITGSYTTDPNAWLAPLVAFAQTGTSFPVRTFTYASVNVSNVAGGANSTGTYSVGSAAMKQLQACTTLANNRLALNSLGLIIGGKTGMLRIW
ncbi:hypothetical protein [Parachitinimonas caeni]|uniref:Uncharacterized protein n=1 Tax=Parachitinimonas caeni TaxID=3031301 RepID=A0ABT7DYL6_9NEIS|nr:hypothetical protein [Parachitinimonas caeni]MDK2125099.1 hypothetical protein [Parachitinimonas caeni]